VTVSRDAIEKLAPDQSALKAAAGLAKPAKWSGLGGSFDGRLIWGNCAGSGANPYRVMADLSDLGSKCTCPSRKFPCKHALALLWLHADKAAFASGETPEWVGDWLSRRRKGTAGAGAAASKEPKDISAALVAEPETVEDPKAIARREAAAERRAVDTRRAILEALDALEQWIGDQLRRGLSGFVDEATARCRQIAARLVDGKAANLAGRVDEMPSRILALPAGDRIRGVAIELGKLVTIARAYRAAPDRPDIARIVAASETREAVLEASGGLRVESDWEVLGERIVTRRDGLVSQTTWLLNLRDNEPRFAMLLDFFPASAGRRGSVFAAGEQFHAELAFYSGQVPLRAVLVSQTVAASAAVLPWPKAQLDGDIGAEVAARLTAEPWQVELPVLLPAGRIAHDASGQPWWRAAAGRGHALRVADLPEGVVRATDLDCCAALWSMNGCSLLAAQTRWGRMDCGG